MEQKLIVLNLSDFKKIGDYLVTRPYSEVASLIDILKTAKIMELPKEETAPTTPPAETL